MRSLAVVELTDGRHYALPRRATESRGLIAGIALHPGMVADLDALQAATAYGLAFRRACRSECTATEVSRYLADRGFARDCIAITIERLNAERAIDDLRAAESHVAVRGARGKRGQRLVRRELQQRGINVTIAEAATVELDDDAAALALAQDRAQRRSWANEAAFATTIGAFLQRRGFDYETARRAVAAAWSDIEHKRQETVEEARPGPGRALTGGSAAT